MTLGPMLSGILTLGRVTPARQVQVSRPDKKQYTAPTDWQLNNKSTTYPLKKVIETQACYSGKQHDRQVWHSLVHALSNS